MMRVDVDFNERDRHGHVVARVPGEQAARLTSGRRVYLYDPLEQLWAEASVARVNEETRIAAFDVDWHSFADAEVADLRDGHAQWFVGVTPTEGLRLPPFAFAENHSAAQMFTWAIRADVTLAPPATGIYFVGQGDARESSSAAGTQDPAAVP